MTDRLRNGGPPRIARRRLLALGGAALCAPALAGIGRAEARGDDLASWPELPLAREGREVRGRLRAGPVRQEVAGQTLDLLGYEGRFPGPLLRLRQGDALTLDVENRLDRSTNLHPHGLSVSPQGNGDNPFLKIAPGGRQIYRFDLGEGRTNAGLFWYHPHYHGTDAAQLYSGLAGPIVVEEPEAVRAQFGDVDERIVVLKDLRIEDGGLGLHRRGDWIPGLEGPLSLVNGQRQPHVAARTRRVRLRIVSAANARYWSLVPEGAFSHALVARDGHVLPAPERARAYALVPGQRIDLILDLPRRGEVRLMGQGVARRGAQAHPSEVLMTFAAQAGAETPSSLPERLAAAQPPRRERPVAAVRDVTLSLFYICGSAYGGPDAAPLYTPRAGTREVWRLFNADLMDHPFHLHTWPFRVLSVNGVRPAAGPPLVDTLNMPPGYRADIEIDFDGPRGRSLFHCHILEHAQKGMMALLEVT